MTDFDRYLILNFNQNTINVLHIEVQNKNLLTLKIDVVVCHIPAYKTNAKYARFLITRKEKQLSKRNNKFIVNLSHCSQLQNDKEWSRIWNYFIHSIFISFCQI